MNASELVEKRDLERRLAEAEATIQALVSGQIDAVIDRETQSPVLLAKAQTALRDSEERYRQIVDATTDGIIKIDQLAQIVFVNRQFAEMLGYEPREMMGVNVFSLMSSSARVSAAQTLQAREPVKDAVDTMLQHKSGSEISVNIAGSALVDEEGKHVGNLAVIRNVTERKKLQAQLMVSDRMASVGTLAAGVAHEINNPLAAVIANLDYVSENLGRMMGGSVTQGSRAAWVLDEIKAPLEDALEAAQRVRFIVRDLKMFSRSPIEEPTGPVDVETVMRSSLRMAVSEIRNRARLVEDYEVVPPVEANEARLGQVFLNLIINATQAMKPAHAERNALGVVVRREGDNVIVEISDTGVGIEPDVLGRVFDAFFTTKAVGAGTGLGLAICQRIVTDIAGELTVESEVGKGSTFRVSLPIARKELRVDAGAGALPVSPAGPRKRVLVVDDDPLVLRGVKRILSGQHDVVAVSAARQARALCARGEKFDVILCDLMMPEMSGMDLHRELTTIAPDQADRFVFLTGGTFTAEARQFLASSPEEHLEKPFDPAHLRAVVGRRLR